MSKVLSKSALGLLTGLTLVASLFVMIPSVTTVQAQALGATIGVDITPGASTKRDNAYAPNPVNANVGDTVTWTNEDSTIHTAVSGNPSDGPTGLFGGSSSGPMIIAPATKQSFTFPSAMIALTRTLVSSTILNMKSTFFC